MPSVDKICNALDESPIWILVADASACTGRWKAKGSGDYNGVEGRWCVWCPADMYWRSGWDCCFPN